MKQIQKVTIIGLGAIGAFFVPAFFAHSEIDLRIVADGERKKRLEQNGIRINKVRYDFQIVTPDMTGEPADLILIAVKGYDLEQALKDIRNQVGPDTLILSLLNGVESEKMAVEMYGEEHVLYSYMRVSIAMIDGTAEFNPESGVLHFGELQNEPDHYSERVLCVKELFDRCGVHYKIDLDMQRGIWFKFMCNVGENLTCAMFGIPYGMMRESEDARYFCYGAMREVVRVANALGIGIGQEDINRQEHTIGRIPYQNKPSTLQDLERGRKTEADMFAGTMVRLGKQVGVETPICEMFARGIRILEEKNEKA